VSELISCDRDGIDRSLFRIMFRVVNDLSTVAISTGSRSKRLIVTENVGGTFRHTGAK
jgi:hypothetical protein